MRFWEYTVGGCVLLTSFVLTMFLKKIAGVAGLLDIPNERSSHTVPTPRGGGLAIVVSSALAMGLLVIGGVIPLRLFLAVGGGGAAVAIVGFLDDRGSLSAGVRLLVHFVAAAWAVLLAGHLGVIRLGDVLIHLGPFGYALSVVTVVWFLNIFNFMDGIDGIAASEAAFVCGSMMLIAKFTGSAAGVAEASCVIGLASVGFLIWNWPPAKIFMGDVGSGYLGFVIAVLGVVGARHVSSVSWAWLTLVGVFLMDSTITLVRRYLRGESVVIAHRIHAYQRAARRLGHRRVTVSIAIINVTWLLPCALAMVIWPMYASWLAVLAFSPLAGLALVFGSGVPESPPSPEVG
jgi:Fuc2NAc and GlcNAc transferase